jgi:hypothetical protein
LRKWWKRKVLGCSAVTVLEDLTSSGGALQAIALIGIAVGVLIGNSFIRLILRFLFRRAVRRAVNGRGAWNLRLPRSHDGPRAEKRRVQRADAAAHMLARILNVLIVAIAAVVASHVLAVDPLVLVSSAGFIGAGLAIGGQAVIKDWLVGFLVLLEDRYAVGDHVVMRVSGQEFDGIVEALNSAGVRLRLDDGATWHAGHGSIESVVNRSQGLIVNRIEVPSGVWSELDQTKVGPRLKAASHDLGLTDVVLLADIQAEATRNGTTELAFKSTRRLSERQRQQVADRVMDSAVGFPPT